MNAQSGSPNLTTPLARALFQAPAAVSRSREVAPANMLLQARREVLAQKTLEDLVWWALALSSLTLLAVAFLA